MDGLNPAEPAVDGAPLTDGRSDDPPPPPAAPGAHAAAPDGHPDDPDDHHMEEAGDGADEGHTPAAPAAQAGGAAAPATNAADAPPNAAFQQMLMQALAVLTPAMLGFNGVNAIPSLVGPAAPFTGESKGTWGEWIRSLTNRMKALSIPAENYVPIVLSLLTGAAAAYANANNLTEDTPWEVFIAVMAAGPWAAKDTTFSLLWRLTGRNLGNGQPVETVTQVEKLKTKLSFTMPSQFWVFVLLSNLTAAFRENLLTGPDGKDWATYEELRSVVLGKAAAQKSATTTNATASKSTPKADTKATWRDKVANGKPFAARTATNGSAGAGPSSSHGAGPSSSNTKKRKTENNPTCFGCGSANHMISDRDTNGRPVCPNYDENRVRKGKYPMHPKPNQGNGKGKRA